MGVTGLWHIVQPCARPIKLETLNRKRLAVDASIWIYQFLKAVRDKEGNALRNSHVVGFFRRICKLLFFGIKPVFVFDGGAPALKRQTILGRKRRREGRREDAVRTAGKLLAVQMQRRGEEDEEKRRREIEVRGRRDERGEGDDEEPLPAMQDMVYVDELGMSNQERQQARKFTKKDAYHLPDLTGSIEDMGRPDDPRIMSSEELEEYARQFHNGEDINVYDFSKIDFDGEFFRSLPAGDRYNILNAARLRSRLRMGLSKDQLEEMFPNRMEFSRFQIERVRERNELTQRLMNLNGMNADDPLLGGTAGGRIAGDRGREYVLVKNDGVEGGWALGVVSTEKGVGERNKPIDVDALNQRVTDQQQEDEDADEEDDFEDVPIEGLNRLPKARQSAPRLAAGDVESPGADGTLFVGQNEADASHDVESDEEEKLNRAIAMSLKTQHGINSESEPSDLEDVTIPEYEQRVVEDPKPLTKSSGRMVAHIVNNRANAAVPKKRVENSNSDDEDDLHTILAASRRQAASQNPAVPSRQNPNNKSGSPSFNAPPPNVAAQFGGPLPFERLNFKTSVFGKSKPKPSDNNKQADQEEPISSDDDQAGGFTKDDEESSKPLPPWLVGNGDIRSEVKEQQAKDLELDAEDRERAREEAEAFRRNYGVIEVGSSDSGSDVEMIECPKPKRRKVVDLTEEATKEPEVEEVQSKVKGSQSEVKDTQSQKYEVRSSPHPPNPNPQEKPELGPNSISKDEEQQAEDSEDFVEWSESERGDSPAKEKAVILADQDAIMSGVEENDPLLLIKDKGEDLNPANTHKHDTKSATRSESPLFENVQIPGIAEDLIRASPAPAANDQAFNDQAEEIFSDGDFNDFSDPEDEELFAQLATEAEEHARFASTLNNKSARENQEAYERELKALRSQQAKDRRDADEVSHIMVTECQALLRLFGLPYVTAPMEAEAQCAELVRLGLVDGVVTDDSDIFLFGGTRVYKNMFNSNKFVECYLLADLERELSLSRDGLIAIAHLLGSDYTEGLAGVGPVSAMELLSEFQPPTTPSESASASSPPPTSTPAASGLAGFRDWWADVQTNARPKEADAASPFRRKFRRSQATKLFLPPAFPSEAVTQAYLRPDVDSDPEPFQWGVPDLDRLRDFLMATIGWTQERTDEVLVPVIRDMNRREVEGTQSNITRFFVGAVGVGARDGRPAAAGAAAAAARQRGEGGSKRMKEAVKKLKATKKGPLSETFGDQAAEWARKNQN